jgi:hypothetical protein
MRDCGLGCDESNSEEENIKFKEAVEIFEFVFSICFLAKTANFQKEIDSFLNLNFDEVNKLFNLSDLKFESMIIYAPNPVKLNGMVQILL